MLAIPVIWVLVDGLVLPTVALIELEEAAAVVSAVESDFGEQEASVTKLTRIADTFEAEGKVVMVVSVGG